MTGRHLDVEALRRFGEGRLEGRELFDVGWHLFLCERCRGLLPEAGQAAEEEFERMFPGVPMEGAEDFSPLLERASARLEEIGRRIVEERTAARELARELAALPARRRLERIENGERFQSFGVAEELLNACRRTWSENPSRAEELAEAAVSVAQLLDPETYGAPMLHDLEAECWASIANCRRIRSDLTSVADAFELAREHHRLGSGDPEEEAHLLDLEASYLIDQRRFAAAEEVLRRTAALYHEAGDRHREGRVLMNLARLRHETGDVREAIALFERADGLLDYRRQPELRLFVRRNLVVLLLEAEDVDEAVGRLPEIRRLAHLASHHERLRLLWTEGRVHAARGDLRAAIRAFESARDGFLAADLGYDAALVSLDLALAALDSGDTGRVRRLARQMVPVFAARGIHREALAALILLQRALEETTASRSFVEHVAEYLHRARENPLLRYRPPPATTPG